MKANLQVKRIQLPVQHKAVMHISEDQKREKQMPA